MWGEKKVWALERFIVFFMNIKIRAHLLQKYSLLPGSKLIHEKWIFYASHLALNTNFILANQLVFFKKDHPKKEKFAD